MVQPEFTNVIGGKVTLERFVQIGAGTIILPNLTIQEGSAIGAMSLVKRSVNNWSIYAGTSLKFIKPRSRELLKYYEHYRNE